MGVKVAAACAVLALAGCGGSSESTSSVSETYANSVCSDVSTWLTDLEGEIKTLGDAGLSINQSDLQDAANQISDATDTMVTDIKELGPPETDAGTEVKDELDKLGTQLTEQVDTIKQALTSNAPALSKASTATGAFSTMASDVSTTWESVKNLDPGGELQDAFENGSDCKSLQEQIDAIGS